MYKLIERRDGTVSLMEGRDLVESYDDHEEALVEQVLRQPLPFPTLNIRSLKENIEDYSLEDLEVLNYESHGVLKMEMRK